MNKEKLVIINVKNRKLILQDISKYPLNLLAFTHMNNSSINSIS